MTGELRLELADPERENRLLHAIIEAISQGERLQSLAAAAAALITDATASDVCFVHVLDDTGRSLTLTGATPPFDQEVGRVRLQLDEGVTGWVARHQAPVVIVDHKEHDTRYRYIASLRGTEYTSMASVPLASDHAGLVGVLNVHTVERREFSERDIRLLTTIGTLLAGAVHTGRLNRRLAVRERELERFAEQVISAQENERQRLAADIHDGVSQRLVSLAYHLDAAEHAVLAEPATAPRELTRARQLTDEALEETRLAIGALRPPVLDDLGLRGGLTSLARTVSTEVVLELADRRLPGHVEIALYRIAQEALQNVQKHANADQIRVIFGCDATHARLEVRDDGTGFDPDDPHAPAGGGFGMSTMAERAELVGGRLSVHSAVGRGTIVIAAVPLI